MKIVCAKMLDEIAFYKDGAISLKRLSRSVSEFRDEVDPSYRNIDIYRVFSYVEEVNALSLYEKRTVYASEQEAILERLEALKGIVRRFNN